MRIGVMAVLLCVSFAASGSENTLQAVKPLPAADSSLQLPSLSPLPPPSPPPPIQPDKSKLVGCYAPELSPRITWGEYLAFIDRHHDDASHAEHAGLNRDPAFLAKHAMTYPAEAIVAGLKEGKVVVLVGITPQGKVSEAIVECSTDPLFHKSALSEANSATFVAAMKNGDAIPAVARIPFAFDNTPSLPNPPIMQENDKK